MRRHRMRHLMGKASGKAPPGGRGQSCRSPSRSSRSPATFSISSWSFCDARCLAWMRADRLTFLKSP
jgi:hypothetical protein